MRWTCLPEAFLPGFPGSFFITINRRSVYIYRSPSILKEILIEKDDAGFRAELKQIDESVFQVGDVTIRVAYSTLNYKDGLAITGKGPVVRHFSMVPGIDLVGTVEHSDSVDYRVGDTVVHTGWGVGEMHPGGLAEKARLKSEWLVPLPEAYTPPQAMAIGTAGYTAMLCDGTGTPGPDFGSG